MEYIIIFFLLIFLLILIFNKQIKYIKKFNESNNLKNISKQFIFKKYIFYQHNPLLLYLYENLYKSLKKINKYDYKSYIIFTNIKTNTDDQLILDWISYTSGLINISIDNIIKILKKKEKINNEFINNLAKLKLFYKIFYKKIDENTLHKKTISVIKGNKTINKKIKNNKVIYNLFYINEILNNISQDYFNNLNKLKLSNEIKNIIKNNKNENYYLLNSIFNNRIDNKYLSSKPSIFSEYFHSL
jgi:hypothetical protein